MTVLARGHGLVESVRWHDGAVWFADWFARDILRMPPGDAAANGPAVEAHLPGMPVCFDWLPDGRLVSTGAPTELLRREPDGRLVRHADLGAIADTPWNDIAVDPHGTVFVNNIGHDFMSGAFRPGLVAAVTPDGAARSVADDLRFPNGMAVIDGGATLLVAESYADRLTAFDIDTDGSLSGRRVWAELGEGAAPDGISLDPSGAVWYASVPKRSCTLVAAGGEVLRAVPFDRGAFDCAVGSTPAGDSALYIVGAEWGGELAGTGQLSAVPLSVR